MVVVIVTWIVFNNYWVDIETLLFYIIVARIVVVYQIFILTRFCSVNKIVNIVKIFVIIWLHL